MRFLKRGRVSLLLVLALAFAVPGAVEAQSEGTGAQVERPSVKPRPGVEAVPGQIIVKFKQDVGPAALADIRRQEGLEKRKDLGLIDAEVAGVRGQSAEQAIRNLERRPDVEYAEPDFVVHPLGYADEPEFAKLWGLHNTGQTIEGSSGKSNMDINGREASARTQGNPNLVVAVIDDGVDFSHPDLSARAWKNPGESGNGKETNGKDDDGNGLVDDVNGWDFANNDNTVHDSSEDSHGTHVAGTIAASVNNKGVVGVAPNVKIMALRFFGAEGGSTSNAILSIQYAKSKGVKISNNSWGGGAYSQALKDAIDRSGQLFVAAAGNSNKDNDLTPTYPASYTSPNILAVAAANNKGNIASFSHWGAKSVDISAPGESILSSVPGTQASPAAVLSSVGTSGGKALTAGFGADEIGTSAGRASFITKAFGAIGRGNQQVVLVDDDQSSIWNKDVGPALSAAIQSATGSAPQVIEVGNYASGPSLSQIQGKTVVWATGWACDSNGGSTCWLGNPGEPTLTSADQSTLTNFLNGGGKLVLTGMDALYLIENSTFVRTTLKLNHLGEFDSATFRGSSGTEFAGESYTFNGPNAVPEWHDSLAPSTSAAATQGLYPGKPATWKFENGTSMAAPHAAGVAALVASKYPSLLGRPTAIKKIILDSGKKLPATVGKTTLTGKMVDAQAALFPRVTATTPVPNKTGVARGANVLATFSDPMRATTINNNTVWLVKDGTTAKISATVTYDSTRKRVKLDPSANLAPNTWYKATVKAGATGVKNAQGDPMLRSRVWKFKTGS